MWVEHETKQLATKSPSITTCVNSIEDTICYDLSRVNTSDEDLNKTDDIFLEDLVFYDVEYLDEGETIENNDNVFDDQNNSTTTKDVEAPMVTGFKSPEGSGCNTIPDTGLILPIDQSSKKLLDAHHRISLNKQSILRGTVNKLKNRLRNSERTSRRRFWSRKQDVYKLKHQNDQLELIRKLHAKDKKLLDDLAKNPVLYNSLRNSTRVAKARRYNQEMKKCSVSLYLCGPRVYRMVQRSNVLCLPAKRTIKRWTNDVRFEPGLNSAILKRIKTLTRKFSDLERVVVLAIDGMKIKSNLTYSAKTDVFHGFPNDGSKKDTEKNKCSILATEAVAVMVRGVYKPFKQVCTLWFCISFISTYMIKILNFPGIGLLSNTQYSRKRRSIETGEKYHSCYQRYWI